MLFPIKRGKNFAYRHEKTLKSGNLWGTWYSRPFQSLTSSSTFKTIYHFSSVIVADVKVGRGNIPPPPTSYLAIKAKVTNKSMLSEDI